MAYHLCAVQPLDKSGVWEQVAAKLQPKNVAETKVLSLDSTSVKAHPDTHGTLKKSRKQAIGKSCGGWNTKIHAVTTGNATLVKFNLSAGDVSDAKEGQFLLKNAGKRNESVTFLMDRVYEGNETREVAKKLGFNFTVPTKRNRKETRGYDRELYKERKTALSVSSAAWRRSVAYTPATISSKLCSARLFT